MTPWLDLSLKVKEEVQNLFWWRTPTSSAGDDRFFHRVALHWRYAFSCIDTMVALLCVTVITLWVKKEEVALEQHWYYGSTPEWLWLRWKSTTKLGTFSGGALWPDELKHFSRLLEVVQLRCMLGIMFWQSLLNNSSGRPKEFKRILKTVKF